MSRDDLADSARAGSKAAGEMLTVLHALAVRLEDERPRPEHVAAVLDGVIAATEDFADGLRQMRADVDVPV